MGMWANFKQHYEEQKAASEGREPRTPEQIKADREEAKAQRRAERDKVKAWRMAHPAEQQMNLAAMMRPWPSSTMGETAFGPVAGAEAEFFNAGARKAWTATRLVGGVATMGTSLVAGRKNKGAAAINIVFPNGQFKSYDLTPDASVLKAANQYVAAFNALSAQLAREIDN
jgi:hypothetical protein